MIYTVTLNPGVDHTLMVDEIALDTVLRASRVYRDCGGKGFNVSRALQLLGVESQALGFIGGNAGKWEERTLNSLGIKTTFDSIAGETRTCIVVMDAKGAHHIKVNEPGPIITNKELKRLIYRVKNLAIQDDYWVFSGSLPQGLNESFYADLIQIVQKVGAKACLDTSSSALHAGVLAAPFLVKPNRLEAEEVIGKQITTLEDFKKTASIFHSKGIELVSLSLGKEGLFLSTRYSSVWAIPPKVNPINPVGSGDALLAGILYGLINQLPLVDIARWGVACGTISVLNEGVKFGRLEEIQELVNRIELAYES